MDTRALDTILSQLQTARQITSGKPLSIEGSAGAQANTFVDLLKRSLDDVNSVQNNAETLAKKFQSGAPEVNLHEVMIAASKANIAFQATVQVRNKLVSAYHDIISMPL